MTVLELRGVDKYFDDHTRGPDRAGRCRAHRGGEHHVPAAPRCRGPRGDAGELMARLGLDRLADRLPSEISLGEQQWTALARAAVVGPRVLVADEPVSHQNRAWAEAMMYLLVDLAAEGTACLLATHDEVAVQAAHRVLELREGRLHEAGARL